MQGGISVALGWGLVVLVIAGAVHHVPPWLLWLDGAGALAAFATAVAFRRAELPGAAAAGAIALALFIVWIVALATHGPSWLAWWNLAFSATFAVLAAFAGARAPLRRPRPPSHQSSHLAG